MPPIGMTPGWHGTSYMLRQPCNSSGHPRIPIPCPHVCLKCSCNPDGSFNRSFPPHESRRHDLLAEVRRRDIRQIDAVIVRDADNGAFGHDLVALGLEVVVNRLTWKHGIPSARAAMTKPITHVAFVSHPLKGLNGILNHFLGCMTALLKAD